ncbi:MAG: hypothetical protein IJ122_05910 [Methanobrevibacter sp.]|nr:hypothetical protein [Methanobrevibacter sp.]
MNIFDLEKLEKEVEGKWVTKTKHPTLPLYNYCYSRNTEYSEHWNEITLRTRGLILDKTGRAVFWCPKKFFNKDQNEIAKEVYNRLLNCHKTYEKLDGSAIWVVNDEQYGLVVSSKSSFSSDQVKWAMKIIAKRYLPADIFFKKGICYAFELIWPENRIVVDYGDEEKLVLWGMATQDGQILELKNSDVDISWFETPHQIVDIENYLAKSNIEGVVLKGEGEDRIKLKSEEYLKLHRLRTECTKKRVLELLENNQRVEDFDFPDEFMKQMKAWQDEILAQYNKYYYQAQTYLEVFKDFSDKDFASQVGFAVPKFYGSLVFAMRKNKSVDSLIYRHIKSSLD